MAGDMTTASSWKILRRLVLGLLVVLCVALFLLWRIDNPRVERFRMALIDRFVPSMEWVLTPITGVSHMLDNYRSYEQIYQQNLELRRELQRMFGVRPPRSLNKKTPNCARSTTFGSILALPILRAS